MTDRLVPCTVVIGTVVADPGVIDPGLLGFRHRGGKLPTLPQPVVHGNGGRHGLLPVPCGLLSQAGGGKGQRHASRLIVRAKNGVIALLAIGLHRGQGQLHHLLRLGRCDTGILQRQYAAAAGEHVPDAFIHLAGGDGSRDVGPRRHQIRQRDVPGAVALCQRPIRTQPQRGVYHPRQHSRRRAPGNHRLRQEGTGLIASNGDPGAVQKQNIPVVGGILRHIGDKPPGRISLGDNLVVDLRHLRQNPRQHVSHLPPGGRSFQTAVQLRTQHFLRLEIPQVPPRRRTAVPTAGVRSPLRVSGAVEASNPSGKNHNLSNGHGVLDAVSTVGPAYGQSILIQRGHIVIKNRGGSQIRKLTGIGPAPDKILLTVRRGLGGDGQSQDGRQQQRRDPAFQHDEHLLADRTERDLRKTGYLPFRRESSNPPGHGPPHRDLGIGSPGPGSPPGPHRYRGTSTLRAGCKNRCCPDPWQGTAPPARPGC